MLNIQLIAVKIRTDRLIAHYLAFPLAINLYFSVLQIFEMMYSKSLKLKALVKLEESYRNKRTKA